MKVERKYYRWYLIGFGKYQMEVETKVEERPLGFYWVKENGIWKVMQWLGDSWNLDTTVGFVQDNYFDKIHEELIEPPKY